MNCDCPFCKEIQERTSNPLEQNRIIYETDHFVVFPTLGSMVENYILIIPKQHLVSVCYIDDSLKNEFVRLVNAFRDTLNEQNGFFPIIFEHGASENDINKGGCCIQHAHLHIVSHKFNNSTVMVKALELIKISGYDEFFTVAYDKPYLFFMDSDNEMFLRVLTDSVVPSQIIRQWIAKDLNMADKWDWRQHPFIENIHKTINNMDSLINKIEVKRGSN